MKSGKLRIKIAIITGLALGITGLHLGTAQEFERIHIFYRELYFLPLILSAFWFGLRGALAVSLAITAAYLPYTLYHWNAFSPDDLDKILEIGLFNIVAGVSGFLRDREKSRQTEKRRAIAAMAGAVAHEMNTPLFAALGTAQLLQEDFEPGSQARADMDQVIEALQTLKGLIKKIARIEDVVLKAYVGGAQIADIDLSTDDPTPSEPVHSTR